MIGHRYSSRREFFEHYLVGNAHAIEFNLAFAEALHLWDDLIDRDKPVDAEAINKGFANLLLVIPANPFYLANKAELHPLIRLAISSWHTANALEATDELQDKEIAFIVRSDYINVFLRSVEIVRGADFARASAPDIRRLWHGEGFRAYLRNLKAEQSARTRG